MLARRMMRRRSSAIEPGMADPHPADGLLTVGLGNGLFESVREDGFTYLRQLYGTTSFSVGGFGTDDLVAVGTQDSPSTSLRLVMLERESMAVLHSKSQAMSPGTLNAVGFTQCLKRRALFFWSHLSRSGSGFARRWDDDWTITSADAFDYPTSYGRDWMGSVDGTSLLGLKTAAAWSSGRAALHSKQPRSGGGTYDCYMFEEGYPAGSADWLLRIDGDTLAVTESPFPSGDAPFAPHVPAGAGSDPVYARHATLSVDIPYWSAVAGSVLFTATHTATEVRWDGVRTPYAVPPNAYVQDHATLSISRKQVVFLGAVDGNGTLSVVRVLSSSSWWRERQPYGVYQAGSGPVGFVVTAEQPVSYPEDNRAYNGSDPAPAPGFHDPAAAPLEWTSPAILNRESDAGHIIAAENVPGFQLWRMGADRLQRLDPPYPVAAPGEFEFPGLLAVLPEQKAYLLRRGASPSARLYELSHATGQKFLERGPLVRYNASPHTLSNIPQNAPATLARI